MMTIFLYRLVFMKNLNMMKKLKLKIREEKLRKFQLNQNQEEIMKVKKAQAGA